MRIPAQIVRHEYFAKTAAIPVIYPEPARNRPEDADELPGTADSLALQW